MGKPRVHRAAAIGGVLTTALLAGCAQPQPQAESEAVVYLTAERWCYETLAEIDCYTAPQPDAEMRRVGWYDEIFVVE